MLAKKKFGFKVLIVMVILGMGFALITFLSPQVEAENELTKIIAYVNIEQIFDNHPRKEQVEEQFNQDVQEMRGNLAVELELELETVTGEERQRLIQNYEEQLRRNIIQKEEELLEPLMSEIFSTVEEVGKDAEVAVILEEDSVLYGGYNLTEKVLKRLESKVTQD